MQTKIVRRDFPGGTVVKNLPMQKKKKKESAHTKQ